MALKLKISAEDHAKLSEELKTAYKQSGADFVLDADGIEDITSLTSALARLKDESGKLRKEAEKFKGVDPERYNQLIAEAEQRETETKEKKGEYESLVAQMKDNHAKDIKKKDDALASMEQSLNEHLIDAAATAAIAEAKGVAQLLLPHIKSHTRVIKADGGKYAVQVIDGDGKPRLNKVSEPMTISELVAEMKNDKVYGRAFEPPPSNGSGSRQREHQQQRQPPNPDEKVKPVDRIRAGLEKLNAGNGSGQGAEE